MSSDLTSLARKHRNRFTECDPRDGFAWHPSIPPWYRVSIDGYLEDWYEITGNKHFRDVPNGEPELVFPRKTEHVRYPRLTLKWRGHRKSKGRDTFDQYVHKLLALCFIPNPNCYKIVRHLDDDPCNFRIDNLMWGNYRHNSSDYIANNPDKIPNASKLTPEKVRMIRILAEETAQTNINYADIARVFGITPRHLSNIVTRRCWQHVK